MTKAFITVGPEDSGNRLMQNLLVQAGCAGTDGFTIPFVQEFDSELPKAGDTPIAWLRSAPHAGSMPQIKAMADLAVKAGYEPFVIIMTRAWWVQRKSQAAHYGHHNEPGLFDPIIQEAYRHIFSEVADLPFIVVSYDELVQRPGYVLVELSGLIGLSKLPDFAYQIADENAKWYEDVPAVFSNEPAPRKSKGTSSRKRRAQKQEVSIEEIPDPISYTLSSDEDLAPTIVYEVEENDAPETE